MKKQINFQIYEMCHKLTLITTKITFRFPLETWVSVSAEH